MKEPSLYWTSFITALGIDAAHDSKGTAPEKENPVYPPERAQQAENLAGFMANYCVELIKV